MAITSRILSEFSEKRPDSPRLFVGSAESENIASTIVRSVPLAEIAKLQNPPAEFLSVSKLCLKNEFRCWAFSDAKRDLFNRLYTDDMILLSVNGTGQFAYAGKVLAKLEWPEFGKTFWPRQKKDPWSLIYFFSEIRSFNANKQEFLNSLSYDRGFALQGTIQVTDWHLYRFREKYCDLHSFWEGLPVHWSVK